MNTRRVRVRPLQGGTGLQRKNDLSTLIYDHGIKFTRIIPTGEVFIVVCLTDNDVDKLNSGTVTDCLKGKQFEVIIPPFMKAKKTVVLKRVDRDITGLSIEDLIADIENRNDWIKIEELNKFPNMPNMLKIRLQDISMAQKATDHGLCVGCYHLSPAQVEMEDYIQITPCWACYAYDHNVKDCPQKDVKKCSECAQTGHTFRDCPNKDHPKCLNCNGQHRTLASRCPVRKQKIKEIREERDNKKKQFEKDNRTYCAVTKLSKEIPKLRQPETPVLSLNSDMSFKATVIIIHAHLANIATPGTFGSTVKELLRKNQLPDVELPDNAPSAQIFKMMTNFPGNDITVKVAEPVSQQDEEEEEEQTTDSESDDGTEIDVTTDERTDTQTARASPTQQQPQGRQWQERSHANR